MSIHSENQFSRLTALKNLGFKPQNILDIGAYNGEWSKMVREIFPEAAFTLFEANIFCREKIEENGFKNYHLEVLGDKNEEVVFNTCLTGCGEGNSIFKEQSVFPFTTEKRQMKKLDDIINDKFDFVKMDTQGAETLIIAGGVKNITSSPFIQVETQVQEYNKNAPFIIDLIYFMDHLGYRVYDIVDSHYNSLKLLIQVDIIFAKKEVNLFHLPCYS